jgi:hypothetical protein
MKNLFLFAFALLFMTACGNPEKTKTASAQSETSKVENQENAPEKDAPKNIAELLQGKWQHEDDKSNYLMFDKNLRKEIADGMDKWDEEPFVLTDACMNAGDVNPEIPKEKDRYISVAESDLCWYIVDVNENMLTLSYMGRGNTLRYNRVKAKGAPGK